MNNDFERKFEELTGFRPFKWQEELSLSDRCGNRLIRIPTGFGKTAGVLAAWIWHRIIKHNDDWPRRLVWCLPMRVLVEQTKNDVRLALKRLGVLWNEEETHDGKVGVHLLMGGVAADQWHLYPECYAVLIGTQDMLLSRAMNRGYASPRARWPMEFGLLNQDALWVMDEVQLMDVGLATSGQLQAFRNEDWKTKKSKRPCFTWWMSATLQREWLEKSPDATDLISELKQGTHSIEPEHRTGHLWDDVQKPLELINTKKDRALAEEISQRHRNPGAGKDGSTLVVLNTVMRAVNVWKILKEDKKLNGTDIRLVHSRFRPDERITWRDDFLNREACSHGTNRIIVSTQVIEAGVDLSASLLITELAPWASLVQRFGRCARWGGVGQVVVADFDHDNDNKAAPYTLDELVAARKACNALHDVAPSELEYFEETHQELLQRLYPYQPLHLLLRHELNELFDTTPDLSGADIDISRFIRSGDERDVQVFWDEIEGDKPAPDRKPTRNELCNIPFLRARDWLCKPKSQNLKPGVYAWVWDWLNREWRAAKRNDLYPGQTILVDSVTGGYHQEQGWDPDSKEPVSPVRATEEFQYRHQPCWKRDDEGWLPSEKLVRTLLPEDHADATEDDESLSIAEGWQTIANHGLQVAEEVQRITSQIIPMQSNLLCLAGRWHDLGKAHPAFQSSIQAENRPNRDDIAKAPDIAWPCSANNMYRIAPTDQRRGFRHELASTLGLFGVLQRHDQDHPALLGPWSELFGALHETNSAIVNSGRDASGKEQLHTAPTTIEREILDLNCEDFDLVAYLVCAHHGKVRMTWHSSPADQNANDNRLRIRGIREGDILPSLLLADNDGVFCELPATLLDLSPAAAGLSPRTGRSWTERVLGLLDRFGPFTLAWLEAILRAADQRASRQTFTDRLLEERHVQIDA